MTIAIGLDFGSLGYRAAFVLDQEIISVPMPPDEATWRGLIFMDPDPNAQPLGLTFSSLKHQLGTGRPFNWRGASQLPEDAVRDILSNIKRAVETYAGDEITRTVIAVPAQYPALRRATVRELGEAAGLGQVALINDCTAAALGHTYGQEEMACTLLLYSMGFIGFEVSLVRYARQRLRELVHEGARAPSGRELDLQTMAAALNALRHQGMDLPTKVFTSHWFDFRYLASDLKEQFSVNEEAILELPPFITGTDVLRVRFQRDNFERAITKQIDTTLAAVNRALEDANLQPDDVDQVLLVGGSTRIGLIQRRLEEQFGDKLVPPRDDLVARGAAVQAWRLAQRASAEPGEDVPQPEEPVFVLESSSSASERQTTLPDPPPEPDIEPILGYARRLAEAGQGGAAIRFLEELERRSQALREQLSEA